MTLVTLTVIMRNKEGHISEKPVKAHGYAAYIGPEAEIYYNNGLRLMQDINRRTKT